MSKTNKLKPNKFNDDDYDSHAHEELMHHRHMKRLKGALKSKNIDALMEMEDEGYYD